MLEEGKYYKIVKKENVMVGKCIIATPTKCKFKIVFDLKGRNTLVQKWYSAEDFESVIKIKDSSIVLEMFK